MRKSNKKSTGSVVKCQDGAFRKFFTVDDLQVDWQPGNQLEGIPGGVLMHGRYMLGVKRDSKFIAA